MEKSKTKKYTHELIEERPLSLIIRVWTRNKEKYYDFAVPKSVIEEYEIFEKVSEKVIKDGKRLNVKGGRSKEVTIDIEPSLMYKFTWLKIQRHVEKLGSQAKKNIKTWHKTEI